MNISEIKNTVVISDMLERLGYFPSYKTANQLFYLSPIRTEETASFSVDDAKGVWFDFGNRKGGNVIDLGLELFEVSSVSEVVKKINILYSKFEDLEFVRKKKENLSVVSYGQHKIRKYQDLGQNQAVIDYLKSRGIYESSKNLKLIHELYYEYSKDGVNKHYFGAAWMNDSGGWEVRSKYGKTCIIGRDISTINSSSSKINIFESMIDYHSAVDLGFIECNEWTIVLNGLAMKDRVINILQNTECLKNIDLYLDHGKGGDNVTAEFCSIFGSKVTDKRILYTGYSDVNDKLNNLPLVK